MPKTNVPAKEASKSNLEELRSLIAKAYLVDELGYIEFDGRKLTRFVLSRVRVQ